MPYPRKTYTPQFKFDRVVEAIRADNLTKVARRYDVGVNLLSRWKTQLLEQGCQLFENDPDKEIESLKKKVAKLEQMIGQKEIELNLLKNFSDFYKSRNTI